MDFKSLCKLGVFLETPQVVMLNYPLPVTPEWLPV